MRATARVLIVAALLAAPGMGARAAEPIVVCGHAPITGAAGAPRHENRYGTFYFDYVNAERAGVDGRSVVFKTYDDRSFPAGARDAYEQCKNIGAHLVVSLIGSAPVAASVARRATEDEVVYLFASGSRAGVPAGGWARQIGPSDEDVGAGLASLISVNRHALAGVRPVVGVIRHDTPYAEPVRDALRRALRRLHIRLSADVLVQKDEVQFSNAWDAMEGAEVNVVVSTLSADEIANMWLQRPVDYAPPFLSAAPIAYRDPPPHTAGIDLLTISDPAPVYDPSDEDLPWHEQIDEFRRIFARYSPESPMMPDRIDWAMYLRAKQVHRYLESLQADTSHDHMRAALDTFKERPRSAFPACALDFTRDRRGGAHAWHLLRARDGAWTQAAHCASPRGADIGAPQILCGDATQRTDVVRCVVFDEASGVRSFAVTDTTGAVLLRGRLRCQRRVPVAARLEPGVHRVKVTVTDCRGQRSVLSGVYVNA